MKIQYICEAVKWADRVNGNTYHSVRVTRCSDGEVIAGEFQYGYGDSYRQTAINEMEKAGWLPKKYTAKNMWMYERENNYPIFWSCCYGTKKECIANGKL